MDLSGHEGEIPITCTHVAGGGGHAQIQTQIHPSYRIILHDSPASPAPLSAATPLKVPVFVKYRECLKNQAVSIGLNATDGCGEFMPSGEEGTLEALSCSACSCHRNFHRKETKFTPFVYKPRPSLGGDMTSPLTKKRQRTKFTPKQKEMMLGFAEKLGWRLQRQEESVVQKFCQEIGVKRRVFKVWMHNNKHNFAKKSSDLQLDTSTDTLNDL